jgi:hypothetical protein
MRRRSNMDERTVGGKAMTHSSLWKPIPPHIISTYFTYFVFKVNAAKVIFRNLSCMCCFLSCFLYEREI